MVRLYLSAVDVAFYEHIIRFTGAIRIWVTEDYLEPEW
jgi:hypothetical protein